MADTNAYSQTSSQPEELSLSHAMKAADSIRRHYGSDDTQRFSPTIPPGVFQGLGAFAVVGVACLPIRRLILGSPSVNTHTAFRNFVDLFVSVGHALLATQAGLIAGSLFGGKTYLDEFVKTSVESPVVEAVCTDLRTNVLPSQLFRPRNLDPNSWDPRMQTISCMIQVIEKCQRRNQDSDF